MLHQVSSCDNKVGFLFWFAHPRLTNITLITAGCKLAEGHIQKRLGKSSNSECLRVTWENKYFPVKKKKVYKEINRLRKVDTTKLRWSPIPDVTLVWPMSSLESHQTFPAQWKWKVISNIHVLTVTASRNEPSRKRWLLQSNGSKKQ